MKKFFILVALAAITATTASAQFGVGVGYVNSVNKGKTGSGSDKDKAMNGFYAGVHYNIPIRWGLSVQPGLNYSLMGASEKEGTEKASRNEHFLNVPIDIKYTFGITDDFKVFAFAGPKFAIGLMSNYKYTDGAWVSYNMYSGKIKTSVGDMDPGDSDMPEGGLLQRFDMQLGIGAGVQFRAVSFKFGYDWGLINRIKSSLDPVGTYKRGQFYVGLGYNF